jgi:UDP-glucose 4-epimerase
MQRILITGSEGLVGKAVRIELEKQDMIVQGLDLLGKGREWGTVLDTNAVHLGLEGCDGVIHLAAVSRVVWGERDPDACWRTNVEGLGNVLTEVSNQVTPPWVIFASSREVYGQPEHLPANEETPQCPVNIYGRSKLAGEELIQQARLKGMRAATIRLSNVYGRTCDHHDRVIPAFARAAVNGHQLRVDGSGHTFDFTHIDDTVGGIVALVHYLHQGNDAPLPIHFLTGQATTLQQLAEISIEIAGTSASVVQASPRSYDVSQFYGCNQRAFDVLGWRPKVSLREGVTRLIADYKSEQSINTFNESLS